MNEPDGVQDFVKSRRAAVESSLALCIEGANPPELYEPARYVLSGKGKRLRPLLVLVGAELYGGKVSAAMPAAVAVEVFHNFTLVHDDIMDRAESRRGRPTVHIKWDESSAILVGDFLMGIAYKQLSLLADKAIPRVLRAFSEMVRRLCEGQMLDMAFADRIEVSVEEYQHMIDRKTGALLGCALEIGGIVAGADADSTNRLYTIGESIGRAFQIQDDLLDLTADSASWGKQVGGDVLEGKRTFLLLSALQAATGTGRDLLMRVVSGQASESDIAPVREVMVRLGTLDAARDAVIFHSDQAIALSKDLPASTSRDVLVDLVRRMKARIH